MGPGRGAGRGLHSGCPRRTARLWPVAVTQPLHIHQRPGSGRRSSDAVGHGSRARIAYSGAVTVTQPTSQAQAQSCPLHEGPGHGRARNSGPATVSPVQPQVTRDSSFTLPCTSGPHPVMAQAMPGVSGGLQEGGFTCPPHSRRGQHPPHRGGDRAAANVLVLGEAQAGAARDPVEGVGATVQGAPGPWLRPRSFLILCDRGALLGAPLLLGLFLAKAVPNSRPKLSPGSGFCGSSALTRQWSSSVGPGPPGRPPRAPACQMGSSEAALSSEAEVATPMSWAVTCPGASPCPWPRCPSIPGLPAPFPASPSRPSLMVSHPGSLDQQVLLMFPNLVTRPNYLGWSSAS